MLHIYTSYTSSCGGGGGVFKCCVILLPGKGRRVCGVEIGGGGANIHSPHSKQKEKAEKQK